MILKFSANVYLQIKQKGLCSTQSISEANALKNPSTGAFDPTTQYQYPVRIVMVERG
jgi:hypothetical protein